MNEQLLNKYYNNLLTAIDQLISAQKYEAARGFIKNFNEPVIKEFFLAEIELREKINRLSAPEEEVPAGVENNEPQAPLFPKLHNLFMSRSGVLNSADKEAIWYPVVSKQDHLVRSYLYLRLLSLIVLFSWEAAPKENSSLWVKQESNFLKNNKKVYAWQWKDKTKVLPNDQIYVEITKEINFLKKSGFGIADKIILFKKKLETHPVQNEESKAIQPPSEIKNEPVKKQEADNIPPDLGEQFEKNFAQQAILWLKRMFLSFSARVMVEKFGTREMSLMEAKGGKIADAPYAVYPHKIFRSIKDRSFHNSVYEKIDDHIKEKDQTLKQQEKKLAENPFLVLEETSLQQLTSMEISNAFEEQSENIDNNLLPILSSDMPSGNPENSKNLWENYFKEMERAVEGLKENTDAKRREEKQRVFAHKYAHTFLRQEIKPVNARKVFIEKHVKFLYKKGPRQKIYADTLVEILQSQLTSVIISKVQTLYVFRLAELGHRGPLTMVNIKEKPYSEDSILLVLDDILKGASVDLSSYEYQQPGTKLLNFAVSPSFFQSRRTSEEHYLRAIELLSNLPLMESSKKLTIATLTLLRKNELIANGKEESEEWVNDSTYRQLQQSSRSSVSNRSSQNISNLNSKIAY